MFLRDYRGQIVQVGDVVVYPTTRYVKMKDGIVDKMEWFHGDNCPKIRVITDNRKVWINRTDRIVKVNG